MPWMWKIALISDGGRAPTSLDPSASFNARFVESIRESVELRSTGPFDSAQGQAPGGACPYTSESVSTPTNLFSFSQLLQLALGALPDQVAKLFWILGVGGQ